MGIYLPLYGHLFHPYMGIYGKFSWYVALTWAFGHLRQSFRGMWPLYGHLFVCSPYVGIYFGHCTQKRASFNAISAIMTRFCCVLGSGKGWFDMVHAGNNVVGFHVRNTLRLC